MWALGLLMELGPHKDRENLCPGWELNSRPTGLFVSHSWQKLPCFSPFLLTFSLEYCLDNFRWTSVSRPSTVTYTPYQWLICTHELTLWWYLGAVWSWCELALLSCSSEIGDCLEVHNLSSPSLQATPSPSLSESLLAGYHPLVDLFPAILS